MQGVPFVISLSTAFDLYLYPLIYICTLEQAKQWDAAFCAVKRLCSRTFCIKSKMSTDSKKEPVEVRKFDGDVII